MIAWWQVLIVFWLVGFQARLVEKMSQDADFKRGAGLFIRLIITAAVWVGAWILLGAWTDINW